MLYRFLLIATILIPSLCMGVNPYKELIRKAGGLKEYPQANIITIFDSTKVDMQESGLSYYKKHVLYKVLTDKGAQQLATLRFDYDPQSAYIRIEKIIIYRSTGKIDTVGANQQFDYPAPARAIYWGARQKMAEVGRLYVGDAVEYVTFKKGYSYALLLEEDDRYIPPMRGHFYDIVPFWSNHPVKIQCYELLIPQSKNLQYEVYNGKLRVNKSEKDGKKRFKFTGKEILKFSRESNMVALSDVAPKLLLSTSPDWQAKSRWFYNVNEDYHSFDPTPEVIEKVNELLENAENENDSISILTHWVADNIRYSGISMGKGEGYTLHNAEMNFTDRCGVCKDKASLLVSMLRAAGFEAYAAMTMAGSRIDPIPADQFNHSITAVRLADGKLHLLDPTWVPFVRELWSSAEQQQNYLIGTAKGEGLEETPISPPENHYIYIDAKTKLHDNGTLTGEITLEAEGQSDAYFRRLFTRRYKIEWDNVVEMELLDISPLFEIDSLIYSNPIDYSTPFKLFVRFTIPEYAFVTDAEIFFTPLLARQVFSSRMPHLNIDTTLTERKYAFKDRCSRLVKLSETVELPSYSSYLPLPENDNLEGTGAAFVSSYEIKHRILKFHQKASFKKRIYSTSDWPSVRHTIKVQAEQAKLNIVLNK